MRRGEIEERYRLWGSEQPRLPNQLGSTMVSSVAGPFGQMLPPDEIVDSLERARVTFERLTGRKSSNGRLTDFEENAGIRGDEPGLENVKTLTGRDFPVVGGSGRDPDSRVRLPLALPQRVMTIGLFRVLSCEYHRLSRFVRCIRLSPIMSKMLRVD